VKVRVTYRGVLWLDRIKYGLESPDSRRELWVISRTYNWDVGCPRIVGVRLMPRLCDLGTLAEWIKRSGPMRLRAMRWPDSNAYHS
jgi:hypothetical protein